MAEAGEDAVAGVVQQVAAVPGHRVLREAAVGGEEVAQLLGLHLLGQDRRADQVGEQQRHEGPLTRRAHLASRDHLRTAAARLSGSTARTSSAIARADSTSPAARDASAAVSSRSRRLVSLDSAESPSVVTASCPVESCPVESW